MAELSFFCNCVRGKGSGVEHSNSLSQPVAIELRPASVIILKKMSGNVTENDPSPTLSNLKPGCPATLRERLEVPLLSSITWAIEQDATILSISHAPWLHDSRRERYRRLIPILERNLRVDDYKGSEENKYYKNAGRNADPTAGSLN